MPGHETLSRRYLGVLVAAAVVILGAGLAARSRLMGPDAARSAPPSEAFTLQRLSQENQLRGISSYIEERVAAVAPLIVRMPAYDASGIRWGPRDSIVTTSPGRPVLLMEAARPDSGRPAFPAVGDSVRRDWVLVVARDAGERVVSWYGFSGGRAAGTCGSHMLEKLVLGLPLTRDFAGAGVFGLDGRIRGMIIVCDGGFAAIPSSEVRRLLSSIATDSARADSALTVEDSISPRALR